MRRLTIGSRSESRTRSGSIRASGFGFTSVGKPAPRRARDSITGQGDTGTGTRGHEDCSPRPPSPRLRVVNKPELAILLTLMQASVEKDFSHARVNRAYEFADLSDYSFKDRFLIRAADLVFYVLINLIGLTARFEVIGWENHEKVEKNGRTSDLRLLARSHFSDHLLVAQTPHRRHDVAQFRR